MFAVFCDHIKEILPQGGGGGGVLVRKSKHQA